jgi:hypothetical protein
VIPVTVFRPQNALNEAHCPECARRRKAFWQAMRETLHWRGLMDEVADISDLHHLCSSYEEAERQREAAWDALSRHQGRHKVS